ncbi:ABC transporter ATP-binding protein [Kineosporia sp. R_H_3]|uniref:ABC transporter ATP-binding protein n=1 Tax=Kineosporia sp. R_H_3 TaxID=1961848 RepID=UPI000B4BFA32|nr:ABC transporter ATP-binding protein [Kineosporia sp. R_H_3]
MNPLLEVDGLSVAAPGRRGTTYPVRDVSLTVEGRGTVGVVGESGCGKSTLLRAIAGVLPRGLRAVEGTVRVDGREVDTRRPSGEVAMIFQDPMTGLNPVMTVGEHVAEVPRRRDGLGRRAAHDLAVHLLQEVGIEDAEHRVDAYPHELSGGLRQRVLIAAALSGSPRLLLCDEPTTALDVTVQARFVALLGRLVEDRGLGVLYVTHDLPLLGTMCDRIDVMYAGQVVERGSTREVLQHPAHPYTEALLAAAPRMDSRRARLVSIPGRPPVLLADTAGCRFAPRCPHAVDACDAAGPLGPGTSGHESACVRRDELEARSERGVAWR